MKDGSLPDDEVGGRIGMERRRRPSRNGDSKGKKKTKEDASDISAPIPDSELPSGDFHAPASIDSSAHDRDVAGDDRARSDSTESVPTDSLRGQVEMTRDALTKAEKTVLLAWENRGKATKQTRITSEQKDRMMDNLRSKRDRIDSVLGDAGLSGDAIRAELEKIRSDLPSAPAERVVIPSEVAVGIEIGEIVGNEIGAQIRQAGSERSESELRLDEAMRILAEKETEFIRHIREQGERGERPIRPLSQKRAVWLSFDLCRFPDGSSIDDLPDDEKSKLEPVLKGINLRIGKEVKKVLASWKSGKRAGENATAEDPVHAVTEEPAEEDVIGNEKPSPVVAAGTLDELYSAIRGMGDPIPGEVSGSDRSGEEWAELLSAIERKALHMDEDKYRNGHWREGIPEMFRSKFVELLDARREELTRSADAAPKDDTESPEPVPVVSSDGEAEVFHTRRAEEKDATVVLAGSIEKNQKIEGLKKQIDDLRARVSEKASIVADLERKKAVQESELARRTALRYEYERRFKGVFGRFFASENMLQQFNREEENARKSLEELSAESVEGISELDRLRADLKEAENDLEQLSAEMPDAGEDELRRMGEESFGPGNYVIEHDSEKLFEGSHDDSVQEKPDGSEDQVFEAAASGVGIDDIPDELTVGMDVWKGEKSGSAGRLLGEFGIKSSELGGINGFEKLSLGQQLLVIENLRQLAVGRIEEEAERKVEKDRKESGFLGRIWKAVSKQYQIAKAEKTTAEEIMHGGIGVHGKVLQQLVNGMLERGPEVSVGEDGKTLELQFAKTSEHASEEDRGKIEMFNRAANEYARIPYEWSLPTASEENRTRYEKAKGEYDIAREQLESVVGLRSESIPEAYLAMNDIDRNVWMMRFLQTNPDLEERLQDIRDQSAWRTAINGIVGERGTYMAYGYVGRTFAASILGSLGAAAATSGVIGVSSVLGWHIGKKRAEKSLVESEKHGRRGESRAALMKKLTALREERLSGSLPGEPSAEERAIEKKIESIDESGNEKNFIHVDTLSTKLEKLLEKIEKKGRMESDDELCEKLKARIAYTKRKLEDGSVDFGEKADNRVWEQYDLIHLLSRAEMTLATHFKGDISDAGSSGSGAAEQQGGADGKRSLDERIESFLDIRSERIGKRQKKHIQNQALKGAAYAAGFSAAGAAIRWLSEAVSDHAPAMPEAKETVRDVLGAPEPAPSAKPDVPVKETVEDVLSKPGDMSGSATKIPSYSLPVEDASAPSAGSTANEIVKATHAVNSEQGPFGSQAAPEGSEDWNAPVAAGAKAEAPNVTPTTNVSHELSPETRAVIAEQEASDRAALANEVLPSQEGIPSGPAEEKISSGAVSEAWGEQAKNARLVTDDVRIGLVGNGTQEAPLQSPPSGPDSVSVDAGRDIAVNHETVQVKSADEVAKEYLSGKTPSGEAVSGQVSAESSIPDTERIREMVKSDSVREYLLTHPEKADAYRQSLADYDASIFGTAQGETGARGVAKLAELNDKVAAKQVMYDCLRLIRDPLTPTFEIKTYQLKDSLNFDQMQNVGEFMMKASERFGSKAAFPLNDESLRAYLERMTALFTERGETIKLNGDTRLLKQLAFQSVKR